MRTVKVRILPPQPISWLDWWFTYRTHRAPGPPRCPQRRETSPRTFQVQFRFVLTLSAPHHPPRGLASDGEDWDHVLRLHRFRGRAHIDSRTTFFLWTDRPSPPWESARAHFVAGKGKISRIAETSRVMFVRIKTSRDGNSNDSFASRQTFSNARLISEFLHPGEFLRRRSGTRPLIFRRWQTRF